MDQFLFRISQSARRGVEWVPNEGPAAPYTSSLVHTSPPLAVGDHRHRSNTVHVVSMSDSNTGIDPFEMWDEVEFSKRTGYHVRKIQRWRKDGGGPPFILEGKKPRYRALSVLRWLEACEQSADRMAS